MCIRPRNVETSRSVRCGSTADPTLDPTLQRLSRSWHRFCDIVCAILDDGGSSASSHVQPRQQAIECGEAGAAAKDAIEAGTHLAAALCGWRRAIDLEVGIKPPDQRAYALLCVAVQIREVSRIHPPALDWSEQRKMANGKLTDIIADDDGLAQEAVGMNAAPQCTLCRDLHRVWSDAHSTDAEAVEMRLPSELIGKVCPRLRRQLADHSSGESTATHVAQGRIIDHVVRVSGAQEIEEVQSALAGPRAEPGEAVFTDLCAKASLSGMARAVESTTRYPTPPFRPARSS